MFRSLHRSVRWSMQKAAGKTEAPCRSAAAEWAHGHVLLRDKDSSQEKQAGPTLCGTKAPTQGIKGKESWNGLG